MAFVSDSYLLYGLSTITPRHPQSLVSCLYHSIAVICSVTAGTLIPGCQL